MGLPQENGVIDRYQRHPPAVTASMGLVGGMVNAVYESVKTGKTTRVRVIWPFTATAQAEAADGALTNAAEIPMPLCSTTFALRETSAGS